MPLRHHITLRYEILKEHQNHQVKPLVEEGILRHHINPHQK